MPEIPLLAAMGGFHLSGTNERIIPQTVADLGSFGMRWMFPSHCTGWRALNALERDEDADGTWRPSDLSDLLDEQSALVLCRRLVREGLLEVVR